MARDDSTIQTFDLGNKDGDGPVFNKKSFIHSKTQMIPEGIGEDSDNESQLSKLMKGNLENNFPPNIKAGFGGKMRQMNTLIKDGVKEQLNQIQIL